MGEQKRISGFDFARAWAILGMMLVNYKIVFTQDISEYKVLDFFIGLLEGRAAAVFLILAGIGIGLMSQRAKESGLPRMHKKIKGIILRRAFFLFLLGMILYGIFDWTADILHHYGLYMVAITFFIFSDQKKIFFAVLGVIAIGLILQILIPYHQGWHPSFHEYLDFYTLRGFLRHTFYNGYHPFFPWFSFMLIGLWMSRFRLKQVQVRGIALLSGAGALIVEGVSKGIIALSGHAEWALYFFDTKPINPSVMYILAGICWSILFISLCIMLTQKFEDAKMVIVFNEMGKMALSHYIFHSIVVLSIFYGIDGLAYRNTFFVFLLSGLTFLWMMIFSYFWQKRFSKGPVESLMRKISG